MTSSERERRARTAGATPPGDWTFQRDGQVFGPVSGLALGAMLEEGRIDGSTRVRREGQPWRELGSIPELVPILREARTRAREAGEARRAVQRERWHASARWTMWTLVVGAVVVVVAAGAAYVSVKRPWRSRSALLAEFGEVTIGAPRFVSPRESAGRREVPVPDLRPTAEPRTAVAAAPGARGGSGATRAERAPRADDGGGILAAQFDPNRIEQVLAQHRARLAECVRGETRRSPDFAGSIPIEFAIGNDGRVTELWIDEPRFKEGPLRACFLDVLRAAAFDPFAGQRPVVSLAFQVASR